MTAAGRMNHYMQILMPTGGDDNRGGQPKTWPPSGPDVWGDVQELTNREQEAVGAMQTVATHVVHTHFDSRITADVRLRRVSPAGQTLEVVGITGGDGSGFYMQAFCHEVI